MISTNQFIAISNDGCYTIACGIYMYSISQYAQD